MLLGTLQANISKFKFSSGQAIAALPRPHGDLFGVSFIHNHQEPQDCGAAKGQFPRGFTRALARVLRVLVKLPRPGRKADLGGELSSREC